MDDRDIEKTLDTLKNEIPVNQVLKRTLRREFSAAKQSGIPKKSRLMKSGWLAAAAAAVACIAFVAYLITPGTVIERANAASLKIYNQLSFVDVGGGSSLGVTEFKGTVYLPVFGKGLFAYDKTGFHRLLSSEVSFVRTSHDGKKLAVSANGSISIYDLAAGQSVEILPADKKNNISYEEPSWSPDDSSLIFTRKQYAAGKTHGFTEKDLICEIELQNKAVRNLVEGSHPSYISGTDKIVFEREQKIISKYLKDGREVTVDNGRFPMVSPDGEYLAYVKTEHRERNAGEGLNAKISEDISNVWIADAGDYKTQKRVTSNYPFEFTDVNQWIKSLKPSAVPQVLALSGRYTYFEPVWSSDSNSLYVLKDFQGGGMRLVKIDFTTEKQTSRDTVKRFLQALVVRDDDYAKSLMKNPPSILTISNPRQAGYRIADSGQEKGREYVDAEIYSEYTANPGYFITLARFYLSPGENGYIIDKMDSKESETVTVDTSQTAIYLTKDGKKQLLFKDSDIPAQYAAKGPHRFASMAYNRQTGDLVFTIQLLQDTASMQKASVKILNYNLRLKEFKLIDHITRVNNKFDAGVESLILDDSGQYAAVDVFSDDDKNFASYTFVYDLKSHAMIELGSLFKDTDLATVHTDFWNDGSLVFKLSSTGQDLGFTYNPETKGVFSLAEK